MYDVNKPECVILALNSEYGKQDELDMLSLYHFKFKPLKGCYKGIHEDSYLVVCTGENDMEDIISLARSRNQESVVILRSDRSAYLHYLNDNYDVELGMFKQVPDHIALQQDAWTFDPSTNQYWICQ